MSIETAKQSESPRKLSLVVFSGSFEKVHYALVMASAALASGREATLFFTMCGSGSVGLASFADRGRRGNGYLD